MADSPTSPTQPIHLPAAALAPADGAPAVRTRAVLGPGSQVQRLGPLTAVYDRELPADTAVDDPARATQRLYYVLGGRLELEDVDDDAVVGVQDGDLAFATAGPDGASWRERNNGADGVHAVMLEYPAEGNPGIREVAVRSRDRMPEVSPAEGRRTRVVLGRGDDHLHGAVHELGDSELDVGASLAVELEEGQSALVLCLDGRIQVDTDGATSVAGVGVGDAVAVPPAAAPREVRIASQASSRVLHAVVGQRTPGTAR